MITSADIVRSWNCRGGICHDTEELLAWIRELNGSTYVQIHECSINESSFWFYDDIAGEILNRKRSFFSIRGIRCFENGKLMCEQPVIVQPEIGYLGMICRKIGGVLHFLMQAKVEPGNVNCVQISPTIQATKSNFLRVHGGRLPAYYELFDRSDRYGVIYDQIQPEQSARFYRKRNRNIIMEVNEEIAPHDNYRWMTLGQIKQLMKIDNLVNMDTRTVVSGMPLFVPGPREGPAPSELFSDEALYRSVFEPEPSVYLPAAFQKIDRVKMFSSRSTTFVPLGQLLDWTVDDRGITCSRPADFMVRYYDIEISGREVRHWMQPLFKAAGTAVFGLITKVCRGKRLYLVRVTSEIGTFDHAEVGPAVHRESSADAQENAVEKLFRERLEQGVGVVADVLLSEEGGRFFHEQNRNVILSVGEDELTEVPDDYLWMDLGTLLLLVQTGGCLNIQLRTLLSLIDL